MGLLTDDERNSLIGTLDKQTDALGAFAAMQLTTGMPREMANLTRVTGIRLVDITNLVGVVDGASAQRADGSWPVIPFIENAIQVDIKSSAADELRRLHDLLLARAGAGQAGITPEGLVNLVAKFGNPQVWVDRMAESMLPVCRIKTPDMLGTGFLIGPDLVMTNYHVMRSVLDQPDALAQVKLEFDYRKDSKDKPLLDTERKTYKLAAGRALLTSPFEELDYALLPVDGKPGDDQVKTRFGMVPRKWLTPVVRAIQQNQYEFILQHPQGDYLSIAVGQITKVLDKRVQYDVNTNEGSSGAPCFNDNWELVALHHAGEDREQPTWNQGIPFGAILAREEVKSAITQSTAGR